MGDRIVESLVSELIDKLIAANSELEADTVAVAAAKVTLRNYALNLLYSGLGAIEQSSRADEQDGWDIENSIVRKLTKQGRHDDAVEFKDLFRRIRAKKSTSLNSVARLLHQLSSSGSAGQRAGSSAIQAGSVTGRDRIVTGLFDSKPASESSALTAEIYSDSLGSEANKNDRKAPEYSSGDRYTDLWGKMTKKLNKDFKIISERELITDMFGCLQGLSNMKYIFYSNEDDSYKLTSEVGNTLPQRSMISAICELGWLCKKIREYIHKTTEPSDSEASRASKLQLTGQSFSSAVSDLLTSYYAKVAVLDGSFKQNPESITLHRLVVWACDEIPTLRLLSLMIDAIEGSLTGGNYLSIVHSFSFHGDPVLKGIVINEILRKTAQPIFTMIYNWIANGNIIDPYREFFVTSRDFDVKNAHLVWNQYLLRKEAIPPFISREFANEILNVGKSILFLRRSEKFEWKGDKELDEALFDYASLEEMRRVIKSISEDVNKRVLKALFERHNTVGHVNAMKRYLLLGKGDMVQDLIEQVDPLLSQSASSISINSLFSILDTLKTSACLQHEDTDFLKHLTIRVSELSNDELGWNVFSLDYRIYDSRSRSPLAGFFQGTMMQYWKTFRFLWSMRRVELRLGGVWRKDVTSRRLISWLQGKDYAAKARSVISENLQNCRHLRMAMFHFNTTLQNYIMFDVIEGAWDAFQKRISCARDFENAMNIHSGYMDEIVSNPCIADEKIRSIIFDLFEICCDFAEYYEGLFRIFEMEMQFSDELEKRAMERTEKGEWGYVHTEDELHGKKFSGQITELQPKYVKLSGRFHAQLESLVKLLNKSKLESIMFLGTRLNYNIFF